MKKLLVAALLVAAPVLAAEPEKSAVKVSFVVFENNANGASEATLGWGSGTVVHSASGKSLVLTNRHVCPHGNGHPFVIVGEKSYAAEWVAADDTVDLALVRVSIALPAVELAESEPLKGTTVRQWGFSLHGPMKAKTGLVVETIEFKTEAGATVKTLVTDIDVEPADSGSGVFDSDGKLVGVAFAAAGPLDGARSEHCVRLTDIKRFLARHR